MQRMLPPIDWVYGNLAITPKPDSKLERRRCWAGYELAATHYDFATFGQAMAYHGDLARFFRESQDCPECHLAMIPEPLRAAEAEAQFAARLQGGAADYCRHVTEALRGMESQDDVCRYRFYLWVRLLSPAPSRLADAARIRSLNSLRQWLDSMDIGPAIPESWLTGWTRTEAGLRASLEAFSAASALKFRPLERQEILQQIRAPFWRSIGTPPLIDGWAPTASIATGQAGEMAVTPDGAAMRRLYGGLIEHPEEDWNHLRVTQAVNGESRTAYQAFLTVEQFSPNPIPLRGGEWAYRLQQQDVGPVELHLRWSARDYQAVLENLASQQRRQADMADQEAQHIGGLTADTYQARSEREELEQYVKASRSPCLLTSIVAVITATTPEILRQRIKLVSSVFDRVDVKLVLNGPDQPSHFYETLVGAPRMVEDYVHRLFPDALATSMFGTTDALLDPAGTFIASDHHGRPLLLDTRRALAQLDTSGSMAFVGPMGKGKSSCANFILWLSVMFGAKGLAIDSAKPERSEWPTLLPYLGTNTRVVTLSAHEQDRGKLDPYTLFSDRTEATNHAVSQAAFLCQVKGAEPSYDVLLKAFTGVRDQSEHPSMTAGITTLERLGRESGYKYRAEAERLGERLRAMSTMAYANLLFGDGTGAGIDTSGRVTVLQLDRIRRPPDGKAVEDYTVDEYLGHAVMVGATAFAAAFSRQDRRQQKVILADEIRWFTNNDYGRELIDQTTLTGRAMGTQVLLCGQNVSHLPPDLLQHFTMRWAFGADSEREAIATLEFLGIEQTAPNVARLMSLNPGDVKGQCLVRDLNGRVGQAWVQLLFDDLLRAFETKSLKEVRVG